MASKYDDVIDLRDVVDTPGDFGFRFVADLIAEFGGADALRDEADNEPALIADRHFKVYAMELAEDIGAIPQEYSWPISCIDWDQATRELRMDYSWVIADGLEFWRHS